MNFDQMHQEALKATHTLRRSELALIPILEQIDACCGYRELGYTSLSAYMIGALKFSEASAHHFITVTRKSGKVQEMRAALEGGSLTISQAKTISPVITNENASKWIAAAQQCSVRELERMVADEYPDARRLEKLRYRGNSQFELQVTLDESTEQLLTRAKEVLAAKQQAPVKLADLIAVLSEEYLDRHDPVRVADRALKEDKPDSPLRERHKANARDRGKCQFRMPDGKKCESGMWVELHHVIPRSAGGPDTADNLTTLCGAHHRIVHDPPATA